MWGFAPGAGLLKIYGHLPVTRRKLKTNKTIKENKASKENEENKKNNLTGIKDYVIISAGHVKCTRKILAIRSGGVEAR